MRLMIMSRDERYYRSDFVSRITHYLANIVYRDIKAISRDLIRYFWSDYWVVFNWRPPKLHIFTQ